MCKKCSNFAIQVEFSHMSDNNYRKLGVAPRFHEILSTGFYGKRSYIRNEFSIHRIDNMVCAVPAAFTSCTHTLHDSTDSSYHCHRRMDIFSDGTILGSRSSCSSNRRIRGLLDTIACSSMRRIHVVICAARLRSVPAHRHNQGCRKIEELCPGGCGVMMDDVLAGTYALIIVYILKLIIF